MINRLIEEYSPMLTALTLQLCQNEADAHDLFQDTWERVVRYARKHSLEKIHNHRAWLCKICTNLYCDRFKRQKKDRQYTCAPEDKELFLQNIPDPESREDYAILFDAIARLTAKQKSVVILRYFYGFTRHEIAEMLSLPEGTVRSRLQDALNKLRRDLNEETAD